MPTIVEFQVAFYVLAGVIIVLAAANIVRKRRRSKLLSQSPHEELNRLERLQLELQEAQRKLAERVQVSDAMLPEVPTIVRPEVAEALTAASSNITREGIPVYQAARSGATTWQDRTLFAPPFQSGWRGSAAIPKLEPHEVPSIGDGDYAFGAATPTLASFLPESDESRRRLSRELKQAGDYAPHARENLAATRFLFMFGSLIFGGVCVLLAPRVLEQPLLIGTLALTALGWALPALLVRAKASTRRTDVERAIPDMMDMLNMCVSQGLTVPDSITRIARDLKPVYPALSQELSIVVDQTRVGTLNEAMQNFADRIDLPQVDSFVSLITQSERMGTSVSDALADYSDNMRESLRQRADERANQASFSLLFPTVLFLMPAVFLFLMGPAVIELAKFTNAGGLEALDEGRQALDASNQRQLQGGRSTTGGQ